MTLRMFHLFFIALSVILAALPFWTSQDTLVPAPAGVLPPEAR